MVIFPNMISLYVRAKIREKAREGSSAPDLSREFGVHVATVYRIISEGERRRKRRGRPLKTSAHERRRILEFFRQNPLASASTAPQALGFSVSASTVRRILRMNNFRYLPARVPTLLLPATVRSRREFALAHVSWNQHQWDKVIFTDEKKFNLIGSDAIRISAWTAAHQRYEISRIQPSQASLMVWGAISSIGTLHLLCTDPSITAQTYVDMLEQDFFLNMEYDLPDGMIWMHDNAPPHRARHTQEYFERKGIEVLKWPPHSPDLNPIENCWGILTQKLYEHGKSYRNTTELWEALSVKWREISHQTIRNLYNSMQKRCSDVLCANGQRIDC